MEDMNRKTSLGIPPWPKQPIAPSPLTMMAPSTLPLTSDSFQVWKKPYFMNHGEGEGCASSSGNNPYFLPPDGNTSPLSLDNDENSETTQNPSDHSPPSNTNPNSTSSGASGAGDCTLKAESGTGAQVRWGRNQNANIDPKKLKRIISNRVSAQKSRMKKLQYVTDMERKVKALEAQITVLSPQVALYRNQQQLLQMEQKSLNQQMTACANNKILKDAEIEDNKAEVNRLRQLHLTQQQQQIEKQARMPVWEPAGLEQMTNPSLNQSGSGQMVYMNTNQAQIGENTAEMNNRLNQLSITQQQPKLGQTWMPSWEPAAPAQMMNPSLNQSGRAQQMVNSNQGGIEQILNFNPMDQNARNCFI